MKKIKPIDFNALHYTGIFLLFGLLFVQCQPEREVVTTVIYPEFVDFFKECNVTGSIAIYDMDKEEWMVSDTIGIYEATLPASTFKILNLLIALETGVIDDEEEVIHFKDKADTLRYGYRPGTYRNMTVSEAFEASAVWVFLDLAERIGKDNYRQYLQRINYGNQYVDEENLDFWNFGELRISPVDQVNFLIDLYEERLPFSKKNIDIVKAVMLSEIGPNYTVHGKTGWTSEAGVNIGWWVGYVEKDDNVYVFATRLLQDQEQRTADFGICRKRITEQVFERFIY